MSIESEFQYECICLVASLAASAAENLPLDQRIMIHRGIACIFPADSNVAAEAELVAKSLSEAEEHQLLLRNILSGQ